MEFFHCLRRKLHPHDMVFQEGHEDWNHCLRPACPLYGNLLGTWQPRVTTGALLSQIVSVTSGIAGTNHVTSAAYSRKGLSFWLTVQTLHFWGLKHRNSQLSRAAWVEQNCAQEQRGKRRGRATLLGGKSQPSGLPLLTKPNLRAKPHWWMPQAQA